MTLDLRVEVKQAKLQIGWKENLAASAVSWGNVGSPDSGKAEGRGAPIEPSRMSLGELLYHALSGRFALPG